MSLSNEVALKIANSATGEVCSSVEFLYDGASSRAWKVTSAQRCFVVRMMLPSVDRPTTYQSELALFRLLERMDVPVPTTIACYKDMTIPGVDNPWAITELVEGNAIGSGPLTSEVASQLGEALAKVHSLPVSGFGRLAEQQTGINGQQNSPGDGILARYCYGAIWPFDDSSLTDNAAKHHLATLDSRIRQHEKSIRQIVEDRDVALVHSDIHGKHIFVKNNRLSGIIDFGAAFIGVPDWEFGRLGFELGWNPVKAILDAYLAHTHRAVRLERIYLLALVFTLYKIDRYVREGSGDHKLSRGLLVLQKTLNQLESNA